MAYEKQTWAKGDVVTSAKLNHMEDGIATGGGVLAVNVTVESYVYTLDKKWSELKAALDNGTVVLSKISLPTMTQVQILTSCMPSDGGYAAAFISANINGANASVMTYICESEDSYPSYDDN